LLLVLRDLLCYLCLDRGLDHGPRDRDRDRALAQRELEAQLHYRLTDQHPCHFPDRIE
jgi:hypothetical protein